MIDPRIQIAVGFLFLLSVILLQALTGMLSGLWDAISVVY